MERNIFFKTIIKKYAKENGIIERHIFDLSVFEKWLINIFYDVVYQNRKIEYDDKLINFAIKLIHMYTSETNFNLRSTSDISRFEEWLIIKIYNYIKEM